jgi:hypothetical protein
MIRETLATVPLAYLRLRYPNEWITVRVMSGTDHYRPERGFMLTYGVDRQSVWQVLFQSDSGREIYVLFNSRKVRAPSPPYWLTAGCLRAWKQTT